MAERSGLLILGGTGDAAALAQACATQLPRLRTITSLAGRTLTPTPIAGETHVGGFGGIQGMTNFMRHNTIGLVIDATHPFAAQISRHAHLACDTLAIPRLQLLRKPWHAHGTDHWIDARDMSDAAQRLTDTFNARSGTRHTRVFLSTGRQQLEAFSHLRENWFLLRTVDPWTSPPPLARYEAITGRGPFTVDEECDLLKEHQIDVLISKNSGGASTYAKILAARSLSLPIIMVRRPAMPPGEIAGSIDEVILWLQARL